MLKRNITFTDFNGEQKTKTYYFNLTKSELIEMETSTEEGFGETLKRIMASDKANEIIPMAKKIILAAYGERSPDGERFMKLDSNGNHLSDVFAETAAYDALFIELATQADAMTKFVQGIMPADMGQSVEQAINESLKQQYGDEEAAKVVASLSSPLPPPPPAA